MSIHTNNGASIDAPNKQSQNRDGAGSAFPLIRCDVCSQLIPKCLSPKNRGTSRNVPQTCRFSMPVGTTFSIRDGEANGNSQGAMQTYFFGRAEGPKGRPLGMSIPIHSQAA